MTREITHLKAFTLGLESLGKHYLSIGQIPPSEEVVNLYFNDSTGEGEDGAVDSTGPWNEGGDWEVCDSPAFEDTERQDRVRAQDGAKADSKSAPKKSHKKAVPK